MCIFLNLPQVHPKHVKEAFRLLNKSIIRVETPDINLDQDDEQEMEYQEEQDGVNGKIFVENFSKGKRTSSSYSLPCLCVCFSSISHLFFFSQGLGILAP